MQLVLLRFLQRFIFLFFNPVNPDVVLPKTIFLYY